MLLILGKNAVKKEKEKTSFHIYFIQIHIFLISDGRFFAISTIKGPDYSQGVWPSGY